MTWAGDWSDSTRTSSRSRTVSSTRIRSRPCPVTFFGSVSCPSCEAGLYFQLPSGGDMPIDDIETTLETTAKASSPGRYRIEFDVDRPPALKPDVDGWLDIDTATLDVDSFFGRVNIEQDKIEQLPRDLQKLFDAYKIAGDVRMRADGTIPFTALMTPSSTSSCD